MNILVAAICVGIVVICGSLWEGSYEDRYHPERLATRRGYLMVICTLAIVAGVVWFATNP